MATANVRYYLSGVIHVKDFHIDTRNKKSIYYTYAFVVNLMIAEAGGLFSFGV